MKRILYPIIILLISCSQQTKSIHQVEFESRKNQPRVNLSKIKVLTQMGGAMNHGDPFRELFYVFDWWLIWSQSIDQPPLR